MKYGIAFFSKGIIYFMAIATLAICAILLPELAREASVENPNMTSLKYPFLFGAYLAAVPILVALYKARKLIDFLNTDKAFSAHSVRILRHIKICAAVFGILIIANCIAGIMVLRSINPQEDVTHIITLGCIFTLASTIVATFIAVLQKLLKEAIAIKTDNDFTV